MLKQFHPVNFCLGHCMSTVFRRCGIGIFTKYGSSDIVESTWSLFIAFQIIKKPANHQSWPHQITPEMKATSNVAAATAGHCIFSSFSASVEGSVAQYEQKTWILIPPSAYPALVNGLFWSCRPKNVLIGWSRSNRDLIKFLFEELEESIDRNCCNSDQIKCWQHHLGCWYPSNFCRSGNAWKFIPWKVLEDAALTPNDRHVTILQLTWGQLVRKLGDFKRQKLSNENGVNFS